ncbi:MAG: hypothetical protein IPI58_05250 [Alphaproteobacteria bacterium]|nr:MAG: hypothetical protein IPI58_05250 [Alphaproteobacteria bacterium]
MDMTTLEERYGEDVAQLCAMRLSPDEIAAMRQGEILSYLKSRMDAAEQSWRRAALAHMHGMMTEVMATRGRILRDRAREVPAAFDDAARDDDDAELDSVLGVLGLPSSMKLDMTTRIESSAAVMAQILEELREGPDASPSLEARRMHYLESRALYLLALYAAPEDETPDSPSCSITPTGRLGKAVQELLDGFGGAEALMATPEQDLIPLCLQARDQMRRLALGQPAQSPEITVTASA